MSYDEKAVVKIDADGDVLKCAKGMDSGECGYKAGAKVCGKCGAMAVAMKMVPVSDEEMEEIDDEDELVKKALAAVEGMDSDEDEEDDEDEDDEEMAPPKMMGKKKPLMYKASDDDMEMDDEDDEEEDEDEDAEEETPVEASDTPTPDSDMADDEEEDDEEEEEDEEEAPMGKGWMGDARKRRLQTMGKKSADVGARGFLCAIDRKVYPGSSSMCDDCPGGCIAEKGMPGLIEIEGKAENEFNGTVIDSGYSQSSDIFVVDLQVKDGRAIEVFMEGSTGEVLGFHRLDDSVFEQKSLHDSTDLVDFNEACDIAVKSLEGVDGTVTAVEPDSFEGFDCYAVEIDGIDGKSYDVFVALDGEVLGVDAYEPDEVEEIEAEAAEIALKRAFNEEQREEMAKEGMALPDGSFPISNVDDLRNAIMAHGRAADKEKAKRHIMKRAREMGKENMIPAAWVTGKKDAEISDGEFMRSLMEFEMLVGEDGDDNGLD
jgi:hypothetical protein